MNQRKVQKKTGRRTGKAIVPKKKRHDEDVQFEDYFTDCSDCSEFSLVQMSSPNKTSVPRLSTYIKNIEGEATDEMSRISFNKKPLPQQQNNTPEKISSNKRESAKVYKKKKNEVSERNKNEAVLNASENKMIIGRRTGHMIPIVKNFEDYFTETSGIESGSVYSNAEQLQSGSSSKSMSRKSPYTPLNPSKLVTHESESHSAKHIHSFANTGTPLEDIEENELSDNLTPDFDKEHSSWKLSESHNKNSKRPSLPLIYEIKAITRFSKNNTPSSSNSIIVQRPEAISDLKDFLQNQEVSDSEKEISDSENISPASIENEILNDSESVHEVFNGPQVSVRKESDVLSQSSSQKKSNSMLIYPDEAVMSNDMSFALSSNIENHPIASIVDSNSKRSPMKIVSLLKTSTPKKNNFKFSNNKNRTETDEVMTPNTKMVSSTIRNLSARKKMLSKSMHSSAIRNKSTSMIPNKNMNFSFRNQTLNDASISSTRLINSATKNRSISDKNLTLKKSKSSLIPNRTNSIRNISVHNETLELRRSVNSGKTQTQVDKSFSGGEKIKQIRNKKVEEEELQIRASSSNSVNNQRPENVSDLKDLCILQNQETSDAKNISSAGEQNDSNDSESGQEFDNNGPQTSVRIKSDVLNQSSRKKKSDYESTATMPNKNTSPPLKNQISNNATISSARHMNSATKNRSMSDKNLTSKKITSSSIPNRTNSIRNISVHNETLELHRNVNSNRTLTQANKSFSGGKRSEKLFRNKNMEQDEFQIRASCSNGVNDQQPENVSDVEDSCNPQNQEVSGAENISSESKENVPNDSESEQEAVNSESQTFVKIESDVLSQSSTRKKRGSWLNHPKEAVMSDHMSFTLSNNIEKQPLILKSIVDSSPRKSPMKNASHLKTSTSKKKNYEKCTDANEVMTPNMKMTSSAIRNLSAQNKTSYKSMHLSAVRNGSTSMTPNKNVSCSLRNQDVSNTTLNSAMQINSAIKHQSISDKSLSSNKSKSSSIPNRTTRNKAIISSENKRSSDFEHQTINDKSCYSPALQSKRMSFKTFPTDSERDPAAESQSLSDKNSRSKQSVNSPAINNSIRNVSVLNQTLQLHRSVISDKNETLANKSLTLDGKKSKSKTNKNKSASQIETTLNESKHIQNESVEIQQDYLQIPLHNSQDMHSEKQIDDISNTLLIQPKRRGRKRKSQLEIELPLENLDEHQPRRSKRNRIPPLQCWRNERIFYHWRDGQVVDVEYHQGNPPDTAAHDHIRKRQKKYIEEKGEAKKKNKPKLEDNVDNLKQIRDEVDKIPINNPITGETEYLFLHRPYKSLLWMTPKTQDLNNPSFTITKSVSKECISFGYIDILPGKKKAEQYAPSDNINFNVIQGKVKILINNILIRLKERDTITVPLGNSYSIQNYGKVNAILYFCAFKYSLLDNEHSGNESLNDK